MLIPKCLGPLSKLCGESMKYDLGVHLERDEQGHEIVAVTDGRAIVIARWSEQTEKNAPPLAITVPVERWNAVFQSPVAVSVELVEGEKTLHAGFVRTSLIDNGGLFPPYQGVLQKFGASNTLDAEANDGKYLRFTLATELFRKILDVFAEMEFDRISFEFPVNKEAEYPMRFTAKSDEHEGVVLSGYLMPCKHF